MADRGGSDTYIYVHSKDRKIFSFIYPSSTKNRKKGKEMIAKDTKRFQTSQNTNSLNLHRKKIIIS